MITWFTEGVPVADNARAQVEQIASLPFVDRMAVMPDVHLGKGATVGSVIASTKAVIPAAVGVDIGCGMAAVKTNINARSLPDSLALLRSRIESEIPVGFNQNESVGDDVYSRFASWKGTALDTLDRFGKGKWSLQVGTLGGGNHFVELCLDENDDVWVMLHSGSRNFGNRIGTEFISKAKEEMERWLIHLPEKDLAYLPEGSELFNDYTACVEVAQEYARVNREVMMNRVLNVLGSAFANFRVLGSAINCHHNYISRENHFGQNVFVTRKGAVRARRGDLGIIPGSMGAKSFIVRGLGNEESLCSCSHGAGRVMSRTEARKELTVVDLREQTRGVECRKDKGVVDEAPSAYKDIDAVMAAQKDLVEVVATLKQVMCIKG